ncbi:hypothetical protein FA13DRAFT_1753383 [Coprinellus micaceus]|uniref:NADH2 dehydrogenase n=1 Tax=Coprinellus micaceus TaxID=71717 RepID=A0A4Y7TN66_COPMI|nr:hypothetical protein FA13DRAFT_1753383 [Coprinellus micaceus]
MFRLTRPLLNVAKRSTGITGLKVHANPLPELTLTVLQNIPETSVYRQGVEALVRYKLFVVESANGDISVAEEKLADGQIEEALDVASDELSLAAKMVEWKSWEPLEEKPEPGQWEYPGVETTAASSS